MPGVVGYVTGRHHHGTHGDITSHRHLLHVDCLDITGIHTAQALRADTARQAASCFGASLFLGITVVDLCEAVRSSSPALPGVRNARCRNQFALADPRIELRLGKVRDRLFRFAYVRIFAAQEPANGRGSPVTAGNSFDNKSCATDCVTGSKHTGAICGKGVRIGVEGLIRVDRYATGFRDERQAGLLADGEDHDVGIDDEVGVLDNIRNPAPVILNIETVDALAFNAGHTFPAPSSLMATKFSDV